MSSKQSLLSHLENLSRDEQAAARAVLDEKRLNADTALGIQRAAELTISQASESATDTALMVQANARLQAATNMLIGQGANTEVADSEDFTTYVPK